MVVLSTILSRNVEALNSILHYVNTIGGPLVFCRGNRYTGGDIPVPLDSNPAVVYIAQFTTFKVALEVSVCYPSVFIHIQYQYKIVLILILNRQLILIFYWILNIEPSLYIKLKHVIKKYPWTTVGLIARHSPKKTRRGLKV